MIAVPMRRSALLVALPLAALAWHLAFLDGYGWFRDEFYYVACARHLAWGYVDQPPFSIAVLWGVLKIAGPALAAIRLIPSACSALTVLGTGLLARELGGGRYAQASAMSLALLLPIYLSIDVFYSMNAIDIVVWGVAALVLLRALRAPGLRVWLWLGVVLGLGALDKISVLWLGAGIAAGLLLTRRRRLLATPGPWVAGTIASLLFAPYVIWQVLHGWPTLEFIHNAGAQKMASTSAIAFMLGQVAMTGPAATIVWIVGLLWLARDAERGRVLFWAWLAVCALLALNRTSRAEYLAPTYTWLLAAGGVGLERLLEERPRWVRSVLLAAALVGTAIFAPLAMPLLPVDGYIVYAAALHVAPSTEERKRLGELPQFFADMQGWDRIVDAVATAADALPAAERSRAVIFAPNYGDAGALQVLGASRGLPPVYSGHNNYWCWGPPPFEPSAVIVMGSSETSLRRRFDHVVRAAETDCGRCMPYENHVPIFDCWGARFSMADLWPQLKHFE
jgi:4-amino-4-deoxy-L-arabinose transferase-like glycosyltransferase